MITPRNVDTAQSVTARVASGQSLKPGQLVKLTQGSAKGEQPTVTAVSTADLDDLSSGKQLVGVVDYITPLETDVDFQSTDPVSKLSDATMVDTTIPAGALVNVWFNKPILGLHSSLIDATYFANVREGDRVGYHAANKNYKAFDATGAATSGEENLVGVVYRVDGPEVTVIFSRI
jgi:hypothetical protein